MNFAKLMQFYHEQTLCDLTIKLLDPYRQKTLQVHKLILAANCPYFETMFKSQFIESSAKEISINVADVHIAYDIIMSFYGQTINSGTYGKWYRELESVKFYHFLGLYRSINYDILMNQPITEEECELICRSIDSMETDPGLEQLFYHNVPKNCDLSDINFYQRFVSRDKNEYLIISTKDNVNFIDLLSGIIVRCHKIEYCKCICSSPDSNHVAICHSDDQMRNYTISIVVVDQGLHVSHQFPGFYEFADQSNYSPNNKQFASVHDKNIIIRRTSDYEQIKIIATETEISYLCYAPDNIMLATMVKYDSPNDNILTIWDTTSGFIKYTFDMTSLSSRYPYHGVHFPNRTMRFLDCQRIIIRTISGILKICDLTNNSCIKSLNHRRDGIVPMYSLTGKNQIITNQLEIIDIDTGLVVDKFKVNCPGCNSHEICLTSDNKLFVLTFNRAYHVWDWHSRKFTTIKLPFLDRCGGNITHQHIGYGCALLNTRKN